MRNQMLQRLSLAGMVMAVAFFGAVHPAFGASEAEQLVEKAEATFKNFQHDPQMTWIRDNIRNAKAVMIAPEVRRAGFVVGGSGGRAVLLARDPATGNWSGPAFYTLATASVGFQAGIDRSETVMLVMSDRALISLLSSQLKLGGDVSIAAGPVGKGGERSITTDVVAFSRSRGIYGGINLDGTLVTLNNEWNNQYYGQTVTPTDILVRRSVNNPKAARLQEQVAQPTTR
jgi:lipid-binding SYLF domain-containing protein